MGCHKQLVGYYTRNLAECWPVFRIFHHQTWTRWWVCDGGEFVIDNRH